VIARTLLPLLLLVASAQTLPPDDPQSHKLPTGVILIKGAEPSASDGKTPLPEAGKIAGNAYRSAYFGLTWPITEEWTEEFSGPPPSDSGSYVLAQLTPTPKFKGAEKATITVTAQDLFFTLLPVHSAFETVRYGRDHLPEYYKVERPPTEVTLAGHPFMRFDYSSPVAGLRWTILATELRCHAVQFLLISRDETLLESLIAGIDGMSLPAPDTAPTCIPDYARGENMTWKVDPEPFENKFNPIPVRLIIGKDGKVKHVHVLSAFPDQSRKITDALLQWRFKPRETEVETGLLFGSSRATQRAAPTTAAAAAAPARD
jgi:hypothetical protein